MEGTSERAPLIAPLAMAGRVKRRLLLHQAANISDRPTRFTIEASSFAGGDLVDNVAYLFKTHLVSTYLALNISATSFGVEAPGKMRRSRIQP